MAPPAWWPAVAARRPPPRALGGLSARGARSLRRARPFEPLARPAARPVGVVGLHVEAVEDVLGRAGPLRRGAPSATYDSIAVASPRRGPACSESSHLCSRTSQYAWTRSRSGPTSPVHLGQRRLVDLAQPALAPPRPRRSAPLVALEPGAVLAQVVEQRIRAWLSRVRSRVRRPSSWAWIPAGRRPTVRSRTDPAGPTGSTSMSTEKPRSLRRRSRPGSPADRPGARAGRTAPPTRPRIGCDRLGRGDRRVDLLVPALEGGEVREAEGDVLDEDVEVERPLAVGQGRVDLARLGVHR